MMAPLAKGYSTGAKLEPLMPMCSLGAGHLHEVVMKALLSDKAILFW